jgi:hypothetical protein
MFIFHHTIHRSPHSAPGCRLARPHAAAQRDRAGAT